MKVPSGDLFLPCVHKIITCLHTGYILFIQIKTCSVEILSCLHKNRQCARTRCLPGDNLFTKGDNLFSHDTLFVWRITYSHKILLCLHTMTCVCKMMACLHKIFVRTTQDILVSAKDILYTQYGNLFTLDGNLFTQDYTLFTHGNFYAQDNLFHSR